MKKTVELLDYLPSHPNDSGWKERHTAAMDAPREKEKGIVFMLRGWLKMAHSHQYHYHSEIGDDYVYKNYFKIYSSFIEIKETKCVIK